MNDRKLCPDQSIFPEPYPFQVSHHKMATNRNKLIPCEIAFHALPLNAGTQYLGALDGKNYKDFKTT